MNEEGLAGKEHISPDYDTIPAAGFHWLTPCYDFVCSLMNLGRGFKRKVAEHLSLRSGERLLDVGCGTGVLLAEVNRRWPDILATGVDPDPAVLRIAKRRLAAGGHHADLKIARAESMPFPDAAFDVVVSTLMLHHLPVEAKHGALREIHRVLSPGGRFLLVDFGSRATQRVPWWQRAFEHIEHLQDHVDGRITTFLSDAGFAEVQCVARHWPAIEFVAATKPMKA